ncbi:MAG TPA: KH domain-containing protein [Acidimicrobiales bacterium]|nr:KH domain-containing protein [Acidimicrobiales bacterium]
MTDSEDVFATDIDVEEEEEDLFSDDVPSGGATDGGAAGAVLDFVARSIVDDPDSVRIETDRDRRGLTLRLHVAPEDMGKVIGRRGRVAQSIRTLVRATGAKEGAEVNVDIVD